VRAFPRRRHRDLLRHRAGHRLGAGRGRLPRLRRGPPARRRPGATPCRPGRDHAPAAGRHRSRPDRRGRRRRGRPHRPSRAGRAGQQRRHRRLWSARDPADRAVPPPAGGQRDRAAGRHPGAAAPAAPGPGPDRADRLDRHPVHPAVHRPGVGVQERHRHHGGCAAAGAGAMGHRRGPDRAGQHPHRGGRQARAERRAAPARGRPRSPRPLRGRLPPLRGHRARPRAQRQPTPGRRPGRGRRPDRPPSAPRYLVGKDALPMAALAALVPTRLLDALRRRVAHQPAPGSRLLPSSVEQGVSR
jgi:hypothetical protein